jgi:hypothetical protein
MSKEELVLSDTTIGHIAQLLQMAILTGTDIIDHLRMAKFTASGTGSNIELHPDYYENFQANIQHMMEELEENGASVGEETTTEQDG